MTPTVEDHARIVVRPMPDHVVPEGNILCISGCDEDLLRLAPRYA